MEEKFTKKELRQIKRADELRTIINIVRLTLDKDVVWEKLHCNQAHGEFYTANARICNVDVEISCVDWGVFKHINISHKKKSYSVSRTKKNKKDFDRLLFLIKEKILEIEKRETSKKPDEDTTMDLPFPPEKDTGPTDQEKLQKVINFLSKND